SGIIKSSITLKYRLSGWLDQIISVTINGTTYNMNTYDSLGNPLTYLDYNVTYQERNISSLVKGSNEYIYSYNSSGIRISKDINGIKTRFLLDDEKIIRETKGDKKLEYFYDINEELIAFS